MLHNLGILNRSANRTAEARNDYEEALTLYRALVVQNPDVYRPDLALTLNRIGVLNHDENRTAEARKNYEEALAARWRSRTLTSTGPTSPGRSTISAS